MEAATSESWKDKTSGERNEKTEWHCVTVWNEGLDAVAERYLREGSKVWTTRCRSDLPVLRVPMLGRLCRGWEA